MDSVKAPSPSGAAPAQAVPPATQADGRAPHGPRDTSSHLSSLHSQTLEAVSVLFTETQKSPSRCVTTLLIHSRVFNTTKFRVSSSQQNPVVKRKPTGPFAGSLCLVGGGRRPLAPWLQAGWAQQHVRDQAIQTAP